MLARTPLSLTPVLFALLLAGCSESPQDVAQTDDEHAGCAISAAASEFLDAVFAGDTQRADARLTPLAAQQLAKSGQRFAPPGSGPTSFAIGEVRPLGEGRAAVECLVRGELDGEPVEEVLGCLMKQVGDRWAVSGIAYETSPDAPPTVFDFEQPAPTPAAPEYATTPETTAPAARTAAAPETPLLR